MKIVLLVIFSIVIVIGCGEKKSLPEVGVEPQTSTIGDDSKEIATLKTKKGSVVILSTREGIRYSVLDLNGSELDIEMSEEKLKEKYSDEYFLVKKSMDGDVSATAGDL